VRLRAKGYKSFRQWVTAGEKTDPPDGSEPTSSERVTYLSAQPLSLPVAGMTAQRGQDTVHRTTILRAAAAPVGFDVVVLCANQQ
jgi:hypothetical protein